MTGVQTCALPILKYGGPLGQLGPYRIGMKMLVWAAWDKKISAGYGIEEPMLGPRASASRFGEFSKIFRSKIKNVHPYSFSSYVTFCTELHSGVNMQ